MSKELYIRLLRTSFDKLNADRISSKYLSACRADVKVQYIVINYIISFLMKLSNTSLKLFLFSEYTKYQILKNR